MESYYQETFLASNCAQATRPPVVSEIRVPRDGAPAAQNDARASAPMVRGWLIPGRGPSGTSAAIERLSLESAMSFVSFLLASAHSMAPCRGLDGHAALQPGGLGAGFVVPQAVRTVAASVGKRDVRIDLLRVRDADRAEEPAGTRRRRVRPLGLQPIFSIR